MRFVFVTLPHWLLGLLMLAGVTIAFANVVARYVFGVAIFWAEEILVFLTIWGVFIGVASITYRREHLNMDLFSAANTSPRVRLALNVALVGVFLACCGFMLVQSVQVVSLLRDSGSVSVSAGVPRWIPNAAIPVGFGLAMLALLVRLRAYLTERD
ncbi:MAG TPA: TRAP transporter small permease [Burkholderiaceae bacterium]|jgi:C4-dicarboxylate transporter, DctQ subunit|nr:TRAP transporter small permease [Burkholderiaceae bacterium]